MSFHIDLQRGDQCVEIATIFSTEQKLTFCIFAAVLPKDKMSISSNSKQNLKTSQFMYQIYRRNIAAQLEQKQIIR